MHTVEVRVGKGVLHGPGKTEGSAVHTVEVRVGKGVLHAKFGSREPRKTRLRGASITMFAIVCASWPLDASPVPRRNLQHVLNKAPMICLQLRRTILGTCRKFLKNALHGVRSLF